MNSKEINKVKNALIDLYLNVKLRKVNEVITKFLI